MYISTVVESYYEQLQIKHLQLGDVVTCEIMSKHVPVMVKCGHDGTSSAMSRKWHTISSLSELLGLRIQL